MKTRAKSIAGLLLLLLSSTQAFAQQAVPDDVDVRLGQGADLTLVETLRAGGGVSVLLAIMSMGTLAYSLYAALQSRRSRIIPDDTHSAVVAMDSGNAAAVAETLSAMPSAYSRAARAGIEARDARAVASALEREIALVNGRLSLLAALGAIAVLLGLTGTIAGAIQGFGAAAREELRYAVVYASVMRSLVSTFFGLAIAVGSSVVYTVLRARVNRAIADLRYAADEFARRHLDTPRDA